MFRRFFFAEETLLVTYHESTSMTFLKLDENEKVLKAPFLFYKNRNIATIHLGVDTEKRG